jgi:hypothetical protein
MSDQELDKLASIPRVYCNAASMAFSVFDFQVTFSTSAVLSTIGGKPDKADVILFPQFLAHFSPQHFKVIATLMATQVMQYEEQFGEINLPAKPEQEENIEKK